MRNFALLILMIGFAVMSSNAQQKEPAKTIKQDQESSMTSPATEIKDGPVMKLDSNVVDYGELIQNGEPLKKVGFTNVGNAPLIIKTARGSCGCTVPTFPKEPIMPGETAEIEIRYATNRVGKFSKKVTITTNEITDNKHIIKVVGKIFREEDAVPASAPSILGGNG